MWHHVTNHLIISNDKDSNSETNENYVFVTVTTKENGMRYIGEARGTPGVMDLQGPPSEHTQTEKLQDLKKLAQQYAHDWGSCDDVQISYLEFVESEAEADLTLAQMISG
jgi:hypothetical protein